MTDPLQSSTSATSAQRRLDRRCYMIFASYLLKTEDASVKVAQASVGPHDLCAVNAHFEMESVGLVVDVPTAAVRIVSNVETCDVGLDQVGLRFGPLHTDHASVHVSSHSGPSIQAFSQA